MSLCVRAASVATGGVCCDMLCRDASEGLTCMIGLIAQLSRFRLPEGSPRACQTLLLHFALPAHLSPAKCGGGGVGSSTRPWPVLRRDLFLSWPRLLRSSKVSLAGLLGTLDHSTASGFKRREALQLCLPGAEASSV